MAECGVPISVRGLLGVARVADAVLFVTVLRLNFWLVAQGIHPFLPMRCWWIAANLRTVISRNPTPTGWVSELSIPETSGYVYSSNGFRGFICLCGPY